MIFSTFERSVAMRYLRPRGKEGLISVIAGFSLLGIALGVATLIVVMSVMNGFRHELLGRLLGEQGHVVVVGIGGSLPDFDKLADKVRATDGVVLVTPIIDGQVMASANKLVSGALVRGMRPDDFRKSAILSTSIKAGNLDDFRGRHSIVVGAGLAAALRVRLGDLVTLISPHGTVTALGAVPRMAAYRVVATFAVGDQRFDSTVIIMPLDAAQAFFKMKDTVSSLQIMIDDPKRSVQIGASIVRDGIRGARIVTWQQNNAPLVNALSVERNVMFLILTLIILVAAFNIVSSMIMLVKDKGRDIAILRTMGATRGMIMRIFFMSGATVGVIGTFAGLGLGWVVARYLSIIQRWIENQFDTNLFPPEVYFLTKIPSVMDPVEVAQVVVLGLGISFIATLYPSWRAARLDPVEALRYE